MGVFVGRTGVVGDGDNDGDAVGRGFIVINVEHTLVCCDHAPSVSFTIHVGR